MLELSTIKPWPICIEVFPLIWQPRVFVRPKGDKMSTHQLQFIAVRKGERTALYGRVYEVERYKETRLSPPSYWYILSQYISKCLQQSGGGVCVGLINIKTRKSAVPATQAN